MFDDMDGSMAGTAGNRKRVAAYAAVAAAIVGMGFGSASASRGVLPRVPGDVSCRFSAAEATLAIRATETLTAIVRRGDELRVRAGRTTVVCAGSTPTRFNVDLIRAESANELKIDLRGGPFAPGHTDEGDGSSEIEIRAVFRASAGGVRVRGTAGADRIRLGSVGGRRAINLDASEARADADVIVTGGFRVLSVLGRGGNDRIRATGGNGFDAPLSRGVAISAGTGRDRIVGTDRRDLIGGGSGGDFVDPRGGRDRVRTQAGVDALRVRDRLRDVVSCGGGRDRARTDAIDKLTGCEVAGGHAGR